MKTSKFADRLKALNRETSFDILARAKALEAEGRRIIHLEIGEPDFDTPANVKAAGIQAIEGNHTHYGPSAGLPEARRVIARHVSETRGVDVSPDQVVVTPGGKSIIFYTMLVLIEPGDEVLYPNPGFPNYEMSIEMVGGKAVPLPLREEHNFDIDPDEVEKRITPKTKLCVINSPHNPTGGVLPEPTLQRILELAQQHDFWVLSDEIYSRMVYDGDHQSFYSLNGASERTILLDGHSKTYAMTGWRLGYGVMPAELARQMAKVAGNCTSCTAAFTQLAGIEALQGPQDEVDAMIEEFRARRDLIVDGLNQLPGFSCHRPLGAFYAFPNITGTGMSSKELGNFLMEKAGVATLPGKTFGEFGEGHIRFSYAASRDDLRSAIEQLSNALSKVR